MEEVTASSVRHVFSRNKMTGNVSDDLCAKAASLCTMTGFTPKDMLNELEALMMSTMENNSNSVLNNALFGKLEQVMNKKKASLAKSADGKQTPASSAAKRKAFTTPGNNKTGDKRAALDVAGISPSASTASNDFLTTRESARSKTVFQMRKDSGKVMITSNAQLGARGRFQRSTREPLGMRCTVDTAPTGFHNVEKRYRYMHTTLWERACALDQHLERVGNDIKEKLAVEESPVGIPSQETVWVCGRVCNETSEGKLNKTSVVLEGSRRVSSGRTVHLDLSEAPSYALFPGQIIVAEGVNANGRRMNVKQVVEGVPRPLPKSKPEKLLEFQHSKGYQNGQALKVVTAAGPFTTSEALDYDPLDTLLGDMMSDQPDVLVLMGPFVDITHPLVKDGDIEIINEDTGETEMRSFEHLFVTMISTLLHQMFDEDRDLPTNIILVPSLNDAFHETVFPQPPMGNRTKVKSELFTEQLGELSLPHADKGKLTHRVHVMPNPCMFKINEVTFGCCSHDSLFALSSDEIAHNAGGDRIARLAKHFIRQQSFFPMFPVPQNSQVQLDFRQAKHWVMDVTPDVLVMPSRLQSMCKNVDGALVVNPGMLTRGTQGGTYAELNIHPMDADMLREAALKAPDEELPHKVEPRTFTRIVKI